jgi:CheY-like chemotaxis protein
VREDIRLGLTVPPTPTCVLADVAQMEQVVINLAVNAQEAMPGGGQLRIELEEQEIEDARPPPAPGLVPGPYVVLEVSDTGAGMTPEVLEHVFEPFFTTKRQGEGTGLGLAIVHGIVQQHGGQVAVESAPGRGSTFRVYLPRSDGVPAAAPKARAPVRGGSETVLIAEDEDAVRAVVVRSLQRFGYRVIAARDGHSCLALADAEPGNIDVLLTDVVMPDMNGRQLHERLAARRPGLRVLFMSGYAGDVVTERGVQEANAAFLQKPFTADALGDAVQRVLAGAR